MFAETLAALILAAQQIVIPFGHPKVNEQPRAPIETSGPLWAAACQGSSDRNRAAPPVRIHANSYLVGTCGLSSMLIVGDQGDVLIDGGEAGDADLISANIRELGYSPSDIRYILHSDTDAGHLGGIAKLQRMSGATIVASPGGAALLRRGSGDEIPLAEAGRIVRDGDEVRLGNILLTAIASPSGGLSWRWVSCETGICRTIVYAASRVPGDSATAASIAAGPCEILVTAMPAASEMVKRLVVGQPLFDQGACKAYATQESAPQ
ncbi:MBL fold metallo-hydrolase [Sphingomonas sp.]|uniref:MBL fold metallo-hydrolase n=1 Tax=Sphingomonas sp. TaxID=28214 RepID=UPI0025F17B88|nr:MBL fold metallo-hydrolase [Sphingomonas sp.]MBV9529205.1 MBL fold metallo-hydrolase [Sphingomonas sp.]